MNNLTSFGGAQNRVSTCGQRQIAQKTVGVRSGFCKRVWLARMTSGELRAWLHLGRGRATSAGPDRNVSFLAVGKSSGARRKGRPRNKIKIVRLYVLLFESNRVLFGVDIQDLERSRTTAYNDFIADRRFVLFPHSGANYRLERTGNAVTPCHKSAAAFPDRDSLRTWRADRVSIEYRRSTVLQSLSGYLTPSRGGDLVRAQERGGLCRSSCCLRVPPTGRLPRRWG